MGCFNCNGPVRDAKHLAVTQDGDPVVLCDTCYDELKIFFEEVKNNGKTDS